MRAALSLLVAAAVSGCAGTPHVVEPTAPVSAAYDVDAQTMVGVVYDATRAQNYRVAVVEPMRDHARFVMMPRAGGSPLVVRLAAAGARHDRFETCLGMCSTTVAVTSLVGETEQARVLLDAITSRARQARLDH
jgi:hypothetical protein